MRVVLSLVAALTFGCASSRPSGPDVDAADRDSAGDDDASSDVDAPAPDSSTPDGAAPDSSSPDGATIDGAAIDGAAIDAQAIDAAVPIDAPTCPTTPCSLSPQCGCTPPLTCDIDFTDLMGTACRAVNVPGTEINTCSSFSECAAGHVCVGGRCHKYCSADGDCGQPRGLCAIQITDTMMNPIPGAITCSANCNPTNSAAGGCPAGQKCGFFTVTRAGQDLDILDCTAPGAGGIGATCTNDSTCSSNTLCTTVSAQTRCRKVCTRPAGNECATVPGTTCIGFSPALTVGGTEYGVCAP